MKHRSPGHSHLSGEEGWRVRWTGRPEELCVGVLADRPKLSRHPSDRLVRAEGVFNAARRDAPQRRCF